jgi:hypothetical protein
VAGDQAWCLECGLAARTRLARTPNWRAPLVAAAVIGLAAMVALVVAFLVLTGDNAPLPVTQTAPGATAPATTTVPVTTPAVTTPTTTIPVPGTTTPPQTTTTTIVPTTPVVPPTTPTTAVTTPTTP